MKICKEKKVYENIEKLLFIIMAVAVLDMPVFCVQAVESDISVTEQSEASPTPSPVPIRELVTKGNKIYYYYKGKMVKNKWKRYNGYKYYFGANGNAVRGGQRINNVVYVFDEKGRLFENKQNKIVKSGSNIYHIRTEHGPCQHWDILSIRIICIMRIQKEGCIRRNPDRTASFILPIPVLQEKIIMLC